LHQSIQGLIDLFWIGQPVQGSGLDALEQVADKAAPKAPAQGPDRRALPRGVTADPDADITLFYANNVIYGNKTTFDNWLGRGSVFKATLYNGDHFVHGYVNVDFGGSRGWENQFTFGSGPGSAHTFGRLHWWVTAGGPNGGIVVPPVASDGTPSLHKVNITLNFDPPERLKLYQFDPFHHDVSVYSLH